jgi:predicted transcriptional regulator
MTDPNVRVSDAELQVLQLLWDESPLDAVELSKRLPEDRSWSLATVKTLLSRLLGKGAVSAEAAGRRFLYAPAIDRETVTASQAKRLVDRLFDGRVSPLVAQLAEERDLDPRDLAELEALVRSLRK